jgi:signal peptidase I
VNFCKIRNIDVAEILNISDEEFDLETTGLSMLPLFDNGSIITIKCTEPHKIIIGDVIVFKSKDQLVAHRVVKKVIENGVEYFKEKGDNNSSSTFINSKDIIGKVIYVRRNPSSDSPKVPAKSINQDNAAPSDFRIRVDSLPARMLGLILSSNDQIIKSLNSFVIHIKDEYCKKRILILFLGCIIYAVRFYKALSLKSGKFLFFLMSRKIKA